MDTGYWRYVGNAYRDENEGYVVLTSNVRNQVGVIWFKDSVDFPFKIEFNYKAGPGTGADGFVLMFFKDSDYTPGYGGAPGFSPDSVTPAPGYGVEFDNWLNTEFSPPDPSSNHIALIEGTARNHLAWANDPQTEDDQWHRVEIWVGKIYIWYVEVFPDGDKVLYWEGDLNTAFL